ncbi:MAG: carbohydrate kinase [Lachnospiraceae bacterium]|nr:carbohydrate kinase [Lachnospiraceae bacterium]
MTDIISVGEALIDLTQNKIPISNANDNKPEASFPAFTAFPGGAPANLAVAAARLGARTAFVGKVGKDFFGNLLKNTLEENKVDTSSMYMEEKAPTTLAVVSVDKNGERSFSFYRDGSADTLLSLEDMEKCNLFNEAKLYHFGSVSLTHPVSEGAVKKGIDLAKSQGLLISYDPNYRPALWKNEETAVKAMLSPIPKVDILKVSDEELPLLTGSRDPKEGAGILSSMGPAVVLVTLGAKGAFLYCKKNVAANSVHSVINRFLSFDEYSAEVPGYPCRVGDTNGAGDTFFGAFLSRIMAGPFEKTFTKEYLKAAVLFANKAASVTTGRHGAIPAMPYLKELLGSCSDYKICIDKKFLE